MEKADVVIVGGGVSGLCCASRVCDAGIDCQLFEASDELGGRVRSDEIDGFILDRGFQVLLTAYPEAQAFLDYQSLDLNTFEPGALIRYRGKFRRFSDPWRRPQYALATAVSPVASLVDKLRIVGLRRKACAGSLADLYERQERSALSLLRDCGLSERIIRSFFKPFLGGVFLEPELTTSSRMFEFVFRMFSRGDAALPAAGMGAIPRQIASELPNGVIRLNAPVKTIRGRQIELENGAQIKAGAIVVATEEPTAANLLHRKSEPAGRSVCCVYFTANRPPISEPILILNGDGTGSNHGTI
jgi:phytoene dehydrogenase-like protein